MAIPLRQQQLAQALGVTDRTVRRWAAEGMPAVPRAPGEPTDTPPVYDLDACQAWAVRAGKQLPGAAPPPPAVVTYASTPPAVPPPPPSGTPAPPRGRLDPQPHGGALHRPTGQPLGGDRVALAAELAALERPDATPIERGRAALLAASKALAAALSSAGGVTGRDFDSFRSSLDGLRQAEKDWLELEARRGELVPLGLATGLMGALARRLVLAGDSLQVMAVDQVEVWLADEAFRALPAAERGRQVRAWVAGVVRGIRLAESEEETGAEIERLVGEALEAAG